MVSKGKTPKMSGLENEDRQMIIEYYQPTFAKLHSQLSGKFFPPPKRASFWRMLIPGKYSPPRALPLLDLYFRELEKELALELSQQSIAYWLHLYRRLAPDCIDSEQRPGIVLETRAILEAAMQKYAKLAPCSRIGLSNEVDSSRILNRMLLDEDIPKDLRSRFKKFFENNSMLVLLEFGKKELCQFYRLEALAHEIWSTIAKRRIIAKGAPLIVNPDLPYISDDRSRELHKLVAIYDSRDKTLIASATGTIFGDISRRQEHNSYVLFPLYNVERTPAIEFKQFFDAFDISFELVENFSFNFNWLPFELKEYHDAHLPFSNSFKEKYGLPFEHIIAVIDALLMRVLAQWQDDTKEIFNYWQRAYKPTFRNFIISEVSKYLPLTIERLGLSINSDDIDVSAIISFFELTEDKRKDIDLATQGPHYLILPFKGDSIFIDYAWIVQLFYNLFYNVELDDQNFKGDVLEALVREQSSPLSSKQLHAKDGTSKQVDAAFDKGKLLISVECKAKCMSFGFFRGDPEAIEHRNKFIDNALSDADNKAKWLASHPLGTNYDIRKFDYILAIVVTPFKEYIPSLDSRYWLEEDVPRILTPRELKEKIGDSSFIKANQASSNAFRIEK